MSGSSWLCRDGMDRERLLDMEGHLRPVRAATLIIIIIGTIVSVGAMGIGTLGLVAVAALVAAGFFRIADHFTQSSERPEYVVFGAWIAAEAVIATCIVLTGGPESPAVAWLAIPIVTLSARFSERGVIIGVLVALALLVAATVGVNPGAVADHPPVLFAPAVLIVCVAILSTALMRSDLHHRGEAVIDQLTGMLNRRALANRSAELAEQSEVSGEPVGLIVGDLDKFKRINDLHGHPAGDAVLTDVAYQLRKRLRAFDLSYRIGGEEFLVLLPGADLDRTRALAEELRGAVESYHFAHGIRVTMSFGVSVSANGRFDYERVFAAADNALYEAKRTGSNRVCDAASLPEVNPIAAAVATPAAVGR